MDEFVINTLTEWNFEDLVEVFNGHKISEESFLLLTENDIKELIPQLGRRRLFLNKFNNFQLQKVLAQSDIVLDVDLSSPGTSNSTISCQSHLENFMGINDVPVTYSHKATVGVPYEFAPVGVNSDNIVKKLIDNSNEGHAIKASYGEGKNFLRNKLANLIISNELKENKDERISAKRFYDLASEIHNCFPHELPETYYVPYVKEVSGKAKSARGKLWSAYIYHRKNYRRLGLLTTSSKVEEIGVNLSDEDSTNSEDSIAFLKNHTSPFEEVKKYWQRSFTKRIKNIATIHSYYDTFPILKEPLGYSLLELDFDQRFADKSNNLFNKWANYAKALLKLALIKQDNYIKSLIQEYEQQHDLKLDGNNLNDADQLFILTLLPLFFSTVNLKNKKSTRRWKPSRIEIRQGFILQVDTAADLEIKKNLRREKYELYGYTEQPIPMFVGTYSKIEGSYVNVNNTYYKVETPLRAVDITFKIYHALNAEYPAEAAIVWNFIEKGIYEIDTNPNQKFVSVSSLLADIKKTLDS